MKSVNHSVCIYLFVLTYFVPKMIVKIGKRPGRIHCKKRCDISVFNGTMAHAFPGHWSRRSSGFESWRTQKVFLLELLHISRYYLFVVGAVQTYNHDVCVIKSPRAKIFVIPNSFLRSLSSQPRSVISSVMPVCWKSVVLIASRSFKYNSQFNR